MYLGFAISLLLHAMLLGWAMFTIQSTAELRRPEEPAISVEIVTPSELLRIKQGDPDAKQLEAKAQDKPNPDKAQKEAPKPKPAPPPPPPPEPETAPQPPAPEPPKAEPAKSDPIAEKMAALAKEPPPPPEPAPGPTPDEQKALEQKLEQERVAEEQRKAEEKRKADEKKKAEEKKKADERKKKLEEAKKLAEAKKKAELAKQKQFDADRISALIDKSPDKRGAPPAAAPSPATPTKNTGPTAGEREGKDSVLSAREQDMLRGLLKSQIAACWRLPGAGGGTDVAIVTLKFRLKQDGALDGEPQVVGAQSTPAQRIAAEAALRAVKGCQPFRLPADLYTSWRDVTWEFDPSQML